MTQKCASFILHVLLSSCSVLVAKKSFPCLPREFIRLLRLLSVGHNSLYILSLRAGLKLQCLRTFSSLLLTSDFPWSSLDYSVPFWNHRESLYLKEFAQLSSILMSALCSVELLLSQILSQLCKIQTPHSIICQRRRGLKFCSVNKSNLPVILDVHVYPKIS